MQLPTFINRRYIILLGIALLAVWLWVAIDHEYDTKKIIWDAYQNGGMLSSKGHDAFDYPLVDSQPIRDMCAAVQWNSTLVFTCDNNYGGVAHVRNSILNCVRYAIAAGGSLVLPNLALREMDEMGQHTHERRHGPGRKGIEYMFDKNHFVDSLRISCPELVLIRHMEQTVSPRRRGLLPESLVSNIPTGGIEAPEEWPHLLRNWIEKSMAPTPQKEPIIVDLEQSFLHYPTHSDGHDVAHGFGSILKFRADVRVLATTTLVKMSEWYDMNLNITEPIINPSFMGVHLGTENPFQEKRHQTDVTYSHYEAQAEAYLGQAASSKIPVMYAASGNIPEIHKLVLQATMSSVAVTHKEDLLKDNDLTQLEALQWDQRALVDYLVLTKAQQFAGVGHSSFSWNIWKKRHESGKKQGGKLTEDVYSDGLSTLYGVRESYVESSRCMWA